MMSDALPTTVAPAAGAMAAPASLQPPRKIL